MKEKVIATVEARVSSSRLPGKVLMPILGKPLLSLLIERIKMARRLDKIVVATSVQKEDDPIVTLAADTGVACYRGSLNDVLARVLGAAVDNDADIIVKLSGDNPLYDSMMIDSIVDFYMENDYDFVSSTAMGFSDDWNEPRTFPLGTGISVFRTDFLKDIEEITRGNPYHREHLVTYVIRNPDKYRLGAFQAEGRFSSYNRPELRFTVDKKEDFELMGRIFEAFYFNNPGFNLLDAIKFIDQNEELRLINKDVKQKGLKK